MGDANIGRALSWLGNLLVEEAKYLYGVEEKVEELREELKWMQLFLQVAETKQDTDIKIREWVIQMNSLADRAEDIIESFILKVEFQREGRGLIKKLKRWSCFMKEAKALHQIGCDVDALKQKIITLTSRLKTYGIKINQGSGRPSAKSNALLRNKVQLSKSSTIKVKDEINIKGLEDDASNIADMLVSRYEPKPDPVTVALCGMRGSGRTTLARMIYHHQTVRHDFDAFGWASISQPCGVKGVIAELLKGLLPEEAVDDQPICLLKDKLREVLLDKRCLVVLDDFVKYSTWDDLKEALPISQGRSKLLVTTRTDNLAKYIDEHSFIFRQALLNDKDAWELLVRRLSRVSSLEEEDMVKLGREMVRYSGGHPFIIIVLAGILAANQSLEKWRTTHDNVELLASEYGNGSLGIRQIVELGYYDLPTYLKPCFLYFGIFPGDAKISVKRLLHLWIAEGFIYSTTSSSSLGDRKSPEDVAQAYLDELVDRSLVQVGDLKTNGRIKTCRMHDLVRETCLSKAAEENFLESLDGVSETYSPLSSVQSAGVSVVEGKRAIRCRRLAIEEQIFGFESGVPSYQKKKKKSDVPHVKSLVLRKMEIPTSNMLKLVKRLRFLRVLSLENVHMRVLPEEVGGLIHLRYLSIRDSYVEVVPTSIGNLRCLQTLDLRSRKEVTQWSPDVIWTMGQLRHAYMPCLLSSMEGMSENNNASTESDLQGCTNNLVTLSNFSQLHRLKDLHRLPNLKKITLSKHAYIDLGHITESDDLLFHGRLEHLSFRWRGRVLIEKPDALSTLSSDHKMKFEIAGRISSSSSQPWSSGCSLGPNLLPQSLTHLTLIDTEIGNADAMDILGSLPCLRQLELISNSYIGEEMIIKEDAFPLLTSLTLRALMFLKAWTTEEGAMPCLRRVSIEDCNNLEMIPDFRCRLQNIQISRCHSIRVSTAEVHGEVGEGSGVPQNAGDEIDLSSN